MTENQSTSDLTKIESPFDNSAKQAKRILKNKKDE
jgi:hypothetical protein